MTGNFTFIDLCAGIGGFRLAGESLGGECVYSCEIDKKAQDTYEANFSSSIDWDDITTLPIGFVPDTDFLFAGFPCQSFSSMNVPKMKAGGDTSIISHIIRILEGAKPRNFILENVPGLEYAGKGETLDNIYTALEACGYKVSIGIVSAQYWVPQLRRRLFFVGVSGDHPYDFALLNRQIPEPPWPVVGSILEKGDMKRYCISLKRWQYHLERSRFRNTYYIEDEGKPAHAIVKSYPGTQPVPLLMGEGYTIPRAYSPREVARIMGYDQMREYPYILPSADRAAYGLLGNGVVPQVVKAILKEGFDQGVWRINDR